MINNDEYLKITKQLDKGWRVIDENRVPFLREVLNWLGNPDQKYKIIHIAGTNGKGSTGEMLNQILQASGYRVGKFASQGYILIVSKSWLIVLTLLKMNL